MPDYLSGDEVQGDILIQEATQRGVLAIEGQRIRYRLAQERSERWSDPEEWVRAYTIAYLVIRKGYPANRIKLEVTVPRRLPSDRADIVVYTQDDCRHIYLAVECKAANQTDRERAQGIEQAFGNGIVLEAPFVLYDEGVESALFVRGANTGYGPLERDANRRGSRSNLPEQYGNAPVYSLVAGTNEDIAPPSSINLEGRIRRAHASIWAGGRRDPLSAFDEWSKLLFAKVADERTTPTGQPRRFQVGSLETSATIATRIHSLFEQACQTDPTIFPVATRISLPDSKVMEVVSILQGISFTRTDVDTVGRAFEQFFGSVFRGGLGQYFTMRQLARFAVGFLDIGTNDFVLDPTSGSGGFLLEALLQVWHKIDVGFAGQPAELISRSKTDFALQHIYGVEIHETLARICKINLLLHHDGHTNIEGNRSILDSTFYNARLRNLSDAFTCVIGNPPFGTDVRIGDDEQLGTTPFNSFNLAKGFNSVESEHLIIERCIDLLQGGGRMALILPDGLFNNQSLRSNCPQVRSYLARNGRYLAVVSLPDHAFKASGAQNKTSLLFYQKFTRTEKRQFDTRYEQLISSGVPADDALPQAIHAANIDYRVFVAEADHVGYTPAGTLSEANDLYKSDDSGGLVSDQDRTILGEYRRFRASQTTYDGQLEPPCAALDFSSFWNAHSTHRLDPKYHVFKLQETDASPPDWIRAKVRDVLVRREDKVDFDGREDELFTVMTISQTGEIRRRSEGKGNNPPEWRGSYFKNSPGDWYRAQAGDVVYSSIDAWKGCIAVVPSEFDGALVTNEFPIFQITDDRLSPEFLQVLLRSRALQRGFRAITTGHSNRRRTQQADFEDIGIAFPAQADEQRAHLTDIEFARQKLRQSLTSLRSSMMKFDDLVDGRGEVELPDVSDAVIEPE